MKKTKLIMLFAGILTCSGTIAEITKKPLVAEDAKCKQLTPKVSDKITYDGKVFTLQWKANAFCGVHKFEYFSEDMKGNFLSYKEMVMIDINQNISGLAPVTVKTFIGGLIRNIQAKKKTDPIANFAVYENKKTNETGIDFLLSGKVKNDDVLEWNFYRSKDMKTDVSNGYFLTYGISRRVYDNDANQMEQFKRMVGEKNVKLGKFAELELPKPF